MDDRIREFVADDAWLFVAVVTLGLTSIVGVAGLEALAGAVAVAGWFLLTPILLFWGEEVAVLLAGDGENESTAPSHQTEPDVDADPLEELKRRYAAGEIDDAEFERRLERLVAVDELPDDAFATGSADGTAGTDADPGTDSLERERKRDRTLEDDSENLEDNRDRNRSRDADQNREREADRNRERERER
ncbi:SHOCT domain-containing protein [Haloterrigena alkaliphila]|uniref:SHOCT domain-containing protein n=1 Tax=Haloterrigena alkaliphila TaxID=2816475 RepID=A0A8A2VGV1_9EURY